MKLWEGFQHGCTVGLDMCWFLTLGVPDAKQADPAHTKCNDAALIQKMALLG